jgi:hypothetical protein
VRAGISSPASSDFDSRPCADGVRAHRRCLRKPFAKVCGLIGLEMRFTPRGLRRTFNDLARLSNVEALVTKSISGHLTDRMRAHYSTVQPVEQRESIGRVLRLVVKAGVTPQETTAGAPKPEGVREREVDAGEPAGIFVGALGIEPTTPTVSKTRRAFPGVTERVVSNS